MEGDTAGYAALQQYRRYHAPATRSGTVTDDMWIEPDHCGFTWRLVDRIVSFEFRFMPCRVSLRVSPHTRARPAPCAKTLPFRSSSLRNSPSSSRSHRLGLNGCTT